MSEDQNTQDNERGFLSSLTPRNVMLGGGTFATIGAVDVLGHLGPTGVLAGGIAAIVATLYGDEIASFARAARGVVSPLTSHEAVQRKLEQHGLLDHVQKYIPERKEQVSEPENDGDIYHANEVEYDDGEDALMPPPAQTRGMLTFSSILKGFTPSLNKIFLGVALDGTPIFCKAEDLCHVALAGSTGGGKSSIMRMLMAQLCKAGAQVLLLNPHYTKYDLKSGEDWTPFEPYLHYDPMECRKYEVILHYLKYTTETLLKKRLDRYAHSLPLGKPYFIVLDELPSIIKHVPDAPGYLSELLREGRKVGIYLISASQDFLVKTIDPSGGGGAVRDCYRTAFYVGGDATTAKVMLDMAPKDIPEHELGRGAVMLRCAMSKAVMKAKRAQVPYVDNEALYKMLGPSTYTPAQGYEMAEEPLPQPGRAPQQYAQPVQETPRPQAHHMEPLQPNPARRVVNVPLEIRTAVEVYQTGMGYRDLGRILNYSDAEARALWQVLHQRYRHLLNVSQPRAATTVLDYEDEPQPQQESMRQELRIALNLYKAGHDSYRKLGEAMGIDKDRAGKLIRELQDMGKIEKAIV